MKYRFVTAACSAMLWTSSATVAQPAVSADETNAIARETYIYAYPLVLSEVTFQVGKNVEKPAGTSAPLNQFGHMRTFPDDSWTIVVRPNADTLYSTLAYDVTREPLIVSIPASGNRYYLLPFLDMWSDVFTVPGTRTTGNGAQTFAIVGPDWKSPLPEGLREYHSPTGAGLMIGRTQTNGTEDYEAVHKFQDGMRAVPLSAYGKPYIAPDGKIDPDQDMSPPPDQIDKMNASTFFETFAELMIQNPPHANDYPILDRMRRIGIHAGKGFRFDDADEVVRDALNAAPVPALRKIKKAWSKAGVMTNGWRTNMTAIGTYGTDYLQRAAVAYGGYGANSIEDAVYPTAIADANGNPLSSAHRYILHFAKDQIPPVSGFWSLTMYNEKQLFAANPIKRYALGDRDKLNFNTDGSLDLYIQRESPGPDKESNWLPTPENGPFTMNLRLYWPKAEVLNGLWAPPPVKRVQ